jgi:hypothetical protein
MPWNSRHNRTVALVLRALLYALAITALVVYAPGSDHTFIYQGF